MTYPCYSLERNSIGGERGLGGKELVKVFEQNIWIKTMQLEENQIIPKDRERIRVSLVENTKTSEKPKNNDEPTKPQLVVAYDTENHAFIHREPQNSVEALLRFEALSFWLRRLDAQDELDRQTPTPLSFQAIVYRKKQRNRITAAPWHLHFDYLLYWGDAIFVQDFKHILASVPIRDLTLVFILCCTLCACGSEIAVPYPRFSNCAEIFEIGRYPYCDVLECIATGLENARFSVRTEQQLKYVCL